MTTAPGAPGRIGFRAAARVGLLSVLLMAASIEAAHATVIISVREVGARVVFDLTGSLDLTGMTFVRRSATCCGGLNFGTQGVIFAASAPTTITIDRYEYAGGSVPGSFGGDGVSFVSASFSGDAFGIWGTGILGPSRLVFLPAGYTSRAPLSSRMVFFSTTIDSLLLDPGTYTWTLPNDSVVMTIVPEPSTATLFALGLTGLGVRRLTARRNDGSEIRLRRRVRD